MKKMFFIIIVALTFTQCSSEDNEINDQIVGKWKLMKAQNFSFNGNFEKDYSNENIIYSFLSNNILIIEGGNNIGYNPGEYDYFFGIDCLGGQCNGNEKEVLLVKINNGTKWTYSLDDKKMILSNSYVDGPTLFFEFQ